MTQNLIPVLYVHYGENWIRGSERVLLDTLARLNRKRFSPLLWCNGEKLKSEAESLGVVTVTSQFDYYWTASSPRFSWRGYLSNIHNASRLIRQYGIRLIHCSSGAPTQWMLPAARLHGLPVITQVHTEYLLRDRFVFGLHHVDKLLGVSRSALKAFVQDGMPESHFAVIHNGVDRGRLQAGDRRDLRALHGISPNDIVVASVCSLIRRKRLDIVLDAARLIQMRGVRFHLLIVGDGPDRAALEKASEGLPATFLGECADVGAILRDAVDILVLASDAEAFPITLIEAASLGIPAIGTAVGGIPEAINDEITGLLIPKDSPDALAQAIMRLVNDRNLAARLGAAAKVKADTELTLERNIEKLESHYENVLSSCTGRFCRPLPEFRPLLSLARRLSRRHQNCHVAQRPKIG